MNKFFGPIILILISVELVFTVINPKYNDIQALQKKNADYDAAIAQSNLLISQRDKLLTKYNSFKGEDLKRLEKLLPDNIDNVRLIIDINSITSKYGVSIANVKLSTSGDNQTASTAGGAATTPGAPTGATGAAGTAGKAAPATIANVAAAVPVDVGQSYNAMILNFSVTTSYSTFLAILADLQRSLRVLDVNSISLKAGDSSSDQYEFDLGVKTYWLKQ